MTNSEPRDPGLLPSRHRRRPPVNPLCNHPLNSHERPLCLFDRSRWGLRTSCPSRPCADSSTKPSTPGPESPIHISSSRSMRNKPKVSPLTASPLPPSLRPSCVRVMSRTFLSAEDGSGLRSGGLLCPTPLVTPAPGSGWCLLPRTPCWPRSLLLWNRSLGGAPRRERTTGTSDDGHLLRLYDVDLPTRRLGPESCLKVTLSVLSGLDTPTTDSRSRTPFRRSLPSRSHSRSTGLVYQQQDPSESQTPLRSLLLSNQKRWTLLVSLFFVNPFLVWVKERIYCWVLKGTPRSVINPFWNFTFQTTDSVLGPLYVTVVVVTLGRTDPSFY